MGENDVRVSRFHLRECFRIMIFSRIPYILEKFIYISSYVYFGDTKMGLYRVVRLKVSEFLMTNIGKVIVGLVANGYNVFIIKKVNNEYVIVTSSATKILRVDRALQLIEDISKGGS